MKYGANNPCCICGGTDSDPVHEMTYPEQGYPGIFAMRRCCGCGLLFNSPRLSDVEIGKLYDKNYYLFAQRDPSAFSRISWLHRRTFGVVESRIPSKRLLEIGSAKGYFLALMKARGWEVSGVELSSYAVRYATKQFGVDVFCGSIEQYVAGSMTRRFPALVTTDVIEHVLDPPQFMAALNQSLDVGGLAVIATPNASASCISEMGSQWGGFNPFHINLFNAENLSFLLHHCGFEVEQTYTYNNLHDAGKQPAESAPLARTFKNGLRATGLIDSARFVRLLAGKALDRVMRPVGRCIRETTTEINGATPYFDTEDGQSELRTECGGDNLVAIARKIHEMKGVA